MKVLHDTQSGHTSFFCFEVFDFQEMWRFLLPKVTSLGVYEAIPKECNKTYNSNVCSRWDS